MIKINQLFFEYSKGQNLFEKLDLEIPSGNVYGLLGKNGAGKTTLLKLIAGLLFARRGTCEVMDYKPEFRRPEMLRELYFIPEEFYLPPIRITDYINSHAPFYPRFDLTRLKDYLTGFQLPEISRLSNLSYGQKKKFLLAFGLATDCKLLILDEPTNGLDIPTKSQFRKLLAGSLSADRTFLISTHQVRDMENLIDPIIILEEGSIIFNASMDKVSRRLAVTLQSEVPDESNVLYYEKVLGGYAVMKENAAEAETKIDLELLFNAVINNRAKIGEIFGQEASHAA